MPGQPIERREFVAGTVAALTAKPSAEAAPAAGGEARKDRIPTRATSAVTSSGSSALPRGGTAPTARAYKTRRTDSPILGPDAR
jgi:hypothetical protein